MKLNGRDFRQAQASTSHEKVLLCIIESGLHLLKRCYTLIQFFSVDYRINFNTVTNLVVLLWNVAATQKIDGVALKVVRAPSHCVACIGCVNLGI